MAYTLNTYQEQIIGTGLQVPNTWDKYKLRTNYNSGVERINQSIKHILGTRVGERFFLPEFGSRLEELVFEPNDYILKDQLELYTNEALTKWEPRITVDRIDAEVEKGNNTVPIKIYYTLINSNITGNYVYPFNRESYQLT